jgi:hypothetical protein
VSLCDAHLLQIKVDSGRDYRASGRLRRTAGGEASGSGGSSGGGEAAEPQGREAGACFWGPGAAARLRAHWERGVAASGGREGEALVPLKFGRRLWVPRALLVPEAGAGAGRGGRLAQEGPAVQHPVQQREQGQQRLEQQEPLHKPPAAPPPPSLHLAAAYFTFDQLCGRHGLRRRVDEGGPLSAVDCLALVDCGCRAVYVEGVPQLGLARRDEARRLVTLVDLLYDRGTRGEWCCGGWYL